MIQPHVSQRAVQGSPAIHQPEIRATHRNSDHAPAMRQAVQPSRQERSRQAAKMPPSVKNGAQADKGS